MKPGIMALNTGIIIPVLEGRDGQDPQFADCLGKVIHRVSG